MPETIDEKRERILALVDEAEAAVMEQQAEWLRFVSLLLKEIWVLESALGSVEDLAREAIASNSKQDGEAILSIAVHTCLVNRRRTQALLSAGSSFLSRFAEK